MTTVSQSQRSHELRKYVALTMQYVPGWAVADLAGVSRFFAPLDAVAGSESARDSGFNSHIEDDGAFAAFAETVAWRLGATRVMIRSDSRKIP